MLNFAKKNIFWLFHYLWICPANCFQFYKLDVLKLFAECNYCEQWQCTNWVGVRTPGVIMVCLEDIQVQKWKCKKLIRHFWLRLLCWFVSNYCIVMLKFERKYWLKTKFEQSIGLGPDHYRFTNIDSHLKVDRKASWNKHVKIHGDYCSTYCQIDWTKK